jgi:hypothetical protein
MAKLRTGAAHIIRFSDSRQTTTMARTMKSFASQADLKPKRITFR